MKATLRTVLDAALHEAETAIWHAQLQTDVSLRARLQRIVDTLSELQVAVRETFCDPKQ